MKSLRRVFEGMDGQAGKEMYVVDPFTRHFFGHAWEQPVPVEFENAGRRILLGEKRETNQERRSRPRRQQPVRSWAGGRTRRMQGEKDVAANDAHGWIYISMREWKSV